MYLPAFNLEQQKLSSRCTMEAYRNWLHATLQLPPHNAFSEERICRYDIILMEWSSKPLRIINQRFSMELNTFFYHDIYCTVRDALLWQYRGITPLRGVILLILLLDYLKVTTQRCKVDNLLSAVQGPSRNFHCSYTTYTHVYVHSNCKNVCKFWADGVAGNLCVANDILLAKLPPESVFAL